MVGAFLGIGDALKMEREIKRDIREMERDQKQRDAVRPAHARVQFQPGKPIVDLSSRSR